jgi:hypothetical protein
MLTWKETPEGWHQAYSGELMVGFVLRRSVDGKIVYNAHEAVHMKHIAKTHGEVSTFASGKRAVERAWSTWLRRAHLQPIEKKLLDEPVQGHTAGQARLG